MRKCLFAIAVGCSFFVSESYSQETNTPGNSFFIGAGFMPGKVVKTKSIFPNRDIRKVYYVQLGQFNTSAESWSAYYNRPYTGLSFFYSDLGNDSTFGSEFNLSTFIIYNLSRRKLNGWQIKLGLGISYFTKHFDLETNQINDAVGSSFTWAFQAFLYRNFILSEHWHLFIGGGYLHGSNGHTKLPNYGINSGMGSIGLRYFTRTLSAGSHSSKENPAKGLKNYFINYRYGMGIHEFGGTSGPVGGPTNIVDVHALSLGIVFNRHIKLRAGFAYRYYHHYYAYIIENNHPEYIDQPRWNASNVYFFMGCEFLMGHIAMDIEGGLNIHKPFYREFFEVYEQGSKLSYQLKRWFPTRLGLNYYVFNTFHTPIHNFFVGANINANFGEADFTEFSIGYTRMLH